VEETSLVNDSENEGADDGPDANEEMYAHSEVLSLAALPPLPSPPLCPVDYRVATQVFDERTEELFSFLQVLTACVGGLRMCYYAACL
jgi:hypothetical protein